MQVKEKQQQQLTLEHIETVLASLGTTLEAYRGWILSESERRYMRSDVIMGDRPLRNALREHNQTHPDQSLPLFGRVTKGLRRLCGIDAGWEEIGPVLTGLRIIKHSEATEASWEKRRENDALSAMLAASERRATSERPAFHDKSQPLQDMGDRKVGGYVNRQYLPATLRWREVRRWNPRTKCYVCVGKESTWELR